MTLSRPQQPNANANTSSIRVQKLNERVSTVTHMTENNLSITEYLLINPMSLNYSVMHDTVIAIFL